MRRIFVDTGAWIGVAVARDGAHEAAAAYARQLAERKTLLVTTNYVLAETYTRIRYDDGHAKAIAFDTLIGEMARRHQLSIRWITPPIHEAALELFRRYDDQDFSVVDCTSFVVVQRLRIRDVFGLDRHFVAMGCILHP